MDNGRITGLNSSLPEERYHGILKLVSRRYQIVSYLLKVWQIESFG